MNFYDKVYELIKCLKENSEYKEFLKQKEELKKDEKSYNMLKDFKEKQKAIQINYINGEKLSDETEKEMQNLYSLLIQNENIRTILEQEMKINILLADMQKIIGQSIGDVLNF